MPFHLHFILLHVSILPPFSIPSHRLIHLGFCLLLKQFHVSLGFVQVGSPLLRLVHLALCLVVTRLAVVACSLFFRFLSLDSVCVL